MNKNCAKNVFFYFIPPYEEIETYQCPEYVVKIHSVCQKTVPNMLKPY